MHTSPPTVEYALTDLGKKLNPILSAIAEVGMKIHGADLKTDGRKPAPEKAEALSSV
jgi:DNA-binding HxlR family transcriptional regulator